MIKCTKGDSMRISNQELKKEKKYLNKVRAVAKKYIDDVKISVDKQKDNIFELKKYIWNECGSMSELEYGNMLNETNAKVQRTNDQLMQVHKYNGILSSAYFGRIDFKTTDDITKVYIGITGLRDDNNNYIFDWRAPICGLFYDNVFGTTEYEAPIGKIKGNVTLRRQYKISNDIIERIIESDINIDDEVLQDVLLSNSSEKMKNIVTTIQKEQNVVIRNTKDRFLIVQGVAGSGKTSVALHRIAYLLYKEKLNYNNILIFSPNNIFSDYISDVLPELGEENVLNTTFNDLINTYLKGPRQIENFSDFLERKYEEKDNNKYNYMNIKDDIDSYIVEFLNSKVFKRDLNINNTFFSRYELNELLIGKYKKLPFLERILNVGEYICNKSNLLFSKNKNKLRSKITNELNIDLDPINIYNNFLKCINSGREINDKILYDDLTNIIYIYFEINGYPYNTEIKHIVVDEAQDYSLLQFSILKRIFPYAYFTILGDVNQMTNPCCSYSSLYEINNVFDNNSHFIQLNKTYRSSAEIIDFANSILDIKRIKSVRGNIGFPVLQRKDNKSIDSIFDDISLLKSNGMKTIAIITKNKKETNDLYKKINKITLNIPVVKNKISKDSVCILPSYISKGLEFDGVIAYTDDDSYYHDINEDKHLFYVVCTRAQHQLIVYNQKKLSKKLN